MEWKSRRKGKKKKRKWRKKKIRAGRVNWVRA